MTRLSEIKRWVMADEAKIAYIKENWADIEDDCHCTYNIMIDDYDEPTDGYAEIGFTSLYDALVKAEEYRKELAPSCVLQVRENRPDGSWEDCWLYVYNGGYDIIRKAILRWFEGREQISMTEAWEVFNFCDDSCTIYEILTAEYYTVSLTTKHDAMRNWFTRTRERAFVLVEELFENGLDFERDGDIFGVTIYGDGGYSMLLEIR